MYCGLSTHKVIDNFVDIGANLGHFAQKLSKNIGLEIINLILVEPDERYEKSLKDLNVVGLQTKNVQICCISEIEGEVTFNIFEDGAKNSLLETNKFGPILSRKKVRTLRGETLLENDPNFQPQGLNILKIDVQGAEQTVLNSFSNKLLFFKYIILEITFKETYQNQSNFLNIMQILDKTHSFAGTLSEVYQNNGIIDYFNAVFINKNYLN